MTLNSAFWDDLAHDLADPEFEREYAAESRRIADVDAAINAEGATANDAQQGRLSVERRRRPVEAWRARSRLGSPRQRPAAAQCERSCRWRRGRDQ